MNISVRDREAVWHPLTQHSISGDPIPIMKGKGAYLFAEDGKRYLDLVSAWWVNLHGHSHPEMAKAIYEQALELEHVIFAGFTHPSAVLLAEQILELLPSAFSKVFYSDNGSTSVEIALKMAYQFWQNQGEKQRFRFVSFEMGYHGDTFGAMAIGKKSGFFNTFSDLLFKVDTFPYPDTWNNDTSYPEREAAVLNQIDDYLKQYAHETVAFILEPLIQGAGGMRMCTATFLQALEKLVHGYNVLIIYDEVMTGFGRTGEYFACQKTKTLPDIICLAKGLTGGFLPLAMTVCHERIYQSFLGNDFSRALPHGHSFTANPLGCAAGLASLKLLKQPATQQQIGMIERTHQEQLQNFSANMPIMKKRYCGTIAAFEVELEASYGSKASYQLRERFLNRGLLIRPLGNTVYLLPPYCITEAELQETYAIISEELQGVTV